MPARILKSFDELLLDCITIIRASTDKVTDFNIGSIARAFSEVNAAMGQYFTQKLEELEEAFYLETSTDEDLDAKVSDFGLKRIPGVKSTGTISFYCYSEPSSPVIIPSGTVIKTQKDTDGNFISFQTIEEISITSSDNYNSTYPYLKSGLAECTEYGVKGNVNSYRISELDDNIAGVAGCINLTPFTSGEEKESNSNLRQRGKEYIQSLAKGTKYALSASIKSLEDVDNVTILDWNDDSSIDPGYMKIILDTQNTNIVPLGQEITLGANVINKEIQINVWNTIKDEVKAAGVGVIFEQTQLIRVNIKINAIVTPEADLNQTSTITQEGYNSIFLNKMQNYFNSILLNENVKWSQILKQAMNIAGIQAISNITLEALDPSFASYVFNDIVITGNKKAILNEVWVNGVMIS